MYWNSTYIQINASVEIVFEFFKWFLKKSSTVKGIQKISCLDQLFILIFNQ